MTRAMCPSGSLSDSYVRALEAAVTWMVVDGRLAVAMKMDSRILHFEVAPNAAPGRRPAISRGPS